MPGDTTRLHISGPELTGIDVYHIRLILEEHGFEVSEQSYETTIISTAFPDDEASMEDVDQVEEEIRQWFSEYVIERSEGYSDQLVGIESVSYMTCIAIERD